jgi:7-cyano-7-deazaguanine synthase
VTLLRRHPRRFSPRPLAGIACVLVSGGLDSAVLLRHFARRYRRVQPLYVRAGLLWEKAEVASLRAFLRAWRSPRILPLAFIDVPMADLYAGHWSTTGRRTPGFHAGDASIYLPGRNLALLSKAGTFCALRRIPVLGSGILNLNPFPDGTPEFFRAMQEALRRGLGTPIRILTPFRALAKDEVIRRGRGLPLDLTLSCANPRSGRHCGRCCKCAERAWAFSRAGVPDPTDYAGGPGAAVPASSGISLRPAAWSDRTTRVAPKNTTRVK